MKKSVRFMLLIATLLVMPAVVSAQDKPCDSISNLPWWEDFQAYPHNTTPPTEPFCWHFQGTNEPSIGQYNVHNGYYTCILDLYSTGVTWAVLQNPFGSSLDVNHLQVTFSAAKSSSSDSHNSDLIIGITTNPTNPSDANFIPMDTLLAIPYNSGDTMPRYSVDFGRYNDTGRYFCFKTQPIRSSGVNFLAIDSLVFDFNDHCMVPGRLRAYTVTDISASFCWNQYRSGHAEFEYKPVDAATWTTVPCLGRYLTLNCFTPETQYMCRVRQDCSVSYNGYSDWSDTVYFTTDSVHCRMPENLILSNVGNTNAELTWTPQGTATEWEVHVFNSSYNRTFSSSTSTLNVTGLSSGTSYRVCVRSLCDASNASDWSDTIMITTNSCFTVGNVTANPTVHEAEILWDDNTNASREWEVSYGLPGFEEGTELGILNVTTNSMVTLVGLDSATAYVAKVRALCHDNQVSDYASVNFVTLGGENGQTEGINEVNGMEVNIYPNPATTSTTISLKGVEGKVNVAVVAVDGRTMQSFVKDCPADCEMTLEVEGLAKGTYVVRIYNDEMNVTRKFSVQ